MRQVLAMCLLALVWSCYANSSAEAAPPPATLSVSTSPPPAELPSGIDQQILPPQNKDAPPSPLILPYPSIVVPDKPIEDWDSLPEWDWLPDSRRSVLVSPCPHCEDDGPRGGVLHFLLRWSQRPGRWERGIHPRMFAGGTPIPGDQASEEKKGNQASKPKGPTTFPQALKQYLRCLKSHGKLLEQEAKDKKKNDKDQGKKKSGEDKGKKKGKSDDKGGNDKGGKSNSLDGSEASQEPPEQGRQEPTPGPAELSPERAGRAVNIEGETGALSKSIAPTWYSAHAQGTVVDSIHDHFHALYSGPLSLIRNEPHATSETTTFFFATRMWEGGDFVFNPEVAGGLGFSGTNGLAGFPNGEITRVGVVEPTPYFARLFYRQVIGFGGEQEQLEDGINQVAGSRDINHLTFAVGRFAMTDVADDNKFSHDPRTQFLNWAIMYNGAWDYPANVRGYTDGIAIDFNQKNWALHYAIAAVSAVANGAALDPHFVKANGQVLEWLGRYKINDRPGNLRLMGYLNHAHMGDYLEALQMMPVNPDVTLTRAYRFKYGYGLSWDQEVTKDIGVFCRLGWDDGHTETWMFTPIDRLVAGGIWISGRSWCRPNDQFGMAFDVNGLAKDHREYLAAGGLDFSIGDGKLNYGHETVMEILYNLGVTKNILFTLDFQEIWNPAYNRDRGPVTVLQGRFHIEF